MILLIKKDFQQEYLLISCINYYFPFLHLDPQKSTCPNIIDCATFYLIQSNNSSHHSNTKQSFSVRLYNFHISFHILLHTHPSEEAKKKKKMEWIRESVDSIKSFQLRQTLSQAVNLGPYYPTSLIPHYFYY